MTQVNFSGTPTTHSGSLSKRMLQGAGVALLLIGLYLAGVDNPNPEWPTYWMVKPLLAVPMAGAFGGAFYYVMDNLRKEGGAKKVMANIASLFAFIVLLWLGTVLGLDGTMWD